MNRYRGKKILIVNIASESPRVGQLAQLQALQQLHPDSLVVLGFPSNSFGHEPLSDTALQAFCRDHYGVTFQLASKQPVKGAGMQPIFQWLSNRSENGVMDQPIKGDFQKFLISESGNLIGVFSPSVEPMSDELKDALNSNP